MIRIFFCGDNWHSLSPILSHFCLRVNYNSVLSVNVKLDSIIQGRPWRWLRKPLVPCILMLAKGVRLNGLRLEVLLGFFRLNLPGSVGDLGSLK